MVIICILNNSTGINIEYSSISKDLEIDEKNLHGAVEELKDKHEGLVKERNQNETNYNAYKKLIEADRRLQTIYKSKVEYIERVFKRAQLYVQKIDTAFSILSQGIYTLLNRQHTNTFLFYHFFFIFH